jgi:phosphatidylserine/phosphatidylglycerophosphate/cardiolipin synthase-like enzyme
VNLSFYNPIRAHQWHKNLLRDHRKLLLVDGLVAYTGGAGISDSFDPRERPHPWQEVMIEIRGPSLADWQDLFVEAWDRWAVRSLSLPAATYRPAGSQSGRVVAQGGLMKGTEIIGSFVNRIRTAEQLVWVATAYFLPSWKIRRALVRSARTGIDVRLLLPGPLTDHPSVRHLGCRYYEQLLRAGIRIFEYQPSFLHAKVLLCDQWVSVGSCNLDRWSDRWSLEANQELDDPRSLARIRAMFETDFHASQEIRYEKWRQRPWYRRRLEGVLGWIEAILLRWGEWKRLGRG